MEENLALLPQEVAHIAENVSAEKRTEVQTVLNHVFNGVSKMREQLDSVIVKDTNDRVNMKLANTIRLGVRQVRLDAEKTFDAKRAEVQAQMLSFKTEDSLWLKAKQVMQILTKEIEENARWKEETKERFEAEQKELKVQQRIVRVSRVAPEMLRSEFENMSDDSFEIFFAGIEKAYNDKIEAEQKAEEERIAKEKMKQRHIQREFEVRDFGRFFDWDSSHEETTDEDFAILIEKAKEAQKKDNDAKEAQRKENERLKAEAEAKEKLLAEERAKAEAERKKIEEAAREEREKAEQKLKAEQEKARIQTEKAEAEKAKLEAEIAAKKAADEKLRKDAESERIAKEAAEKRAANAPDKEKLLEIARNIDNFTFPEIKGEEAYKILSNVKTLLSKVSTYIRENSEKL